MSKKVKVVLAFWRDGKKPGDEVEVSEEEAKILIRDGHAKKKEESKSVEPQNKKVEPPNK